MTPSCPRCAGPVRPPGLAVSGWHCPDCGPVAPLHVAGQINHEVLAAVSARIGAGHHRVPMWCPWPLPPGWLVTGIGWAGDQRTGVAASALACTGPAPLHGGPADIVLIAEEPGVGLGNRYAGLAGTDPGVGFTTAVPHAKVKAAGRDTPMWSVGDTPERAAYVGEACGVWLYAITWPADAAYLLSEHIVLHDIADWMPAELVFGAPSPYLAAG